MIARELINSREMSVMADAEHIYPIGVVQKLTALSCRQIRYYEERGMVSPARSKGNRRMFSQKDIERLMEIRDKLNEGWLLQAIKDVICSNRRDTSNRAYRLNEEHREFERSGA